MAAPRSLKTRLILRSVIAVIFVAAILFIPAGSLRYWQGWGFLSLLFFLLRLPPPQSFWRRSHAARHASGARLLVGAPGLRPRHPFDCPPPPQRRKIALPRPPRLFRLLPPHALPPPPPPLVVFLRKNSL